MNMHLDMNHYRLGASLYVPATRSDLAEWGNGEKAIMPQSIIFCTEDSVHAGELWQAMENLEDMLPRLHSETERPAMRFIRVRDPFVLGSLLQMRGITNIDGFVLPKVTRHNLREYLNKLRDHYYIMPTLETKECGDPDEMKQLRDMLISDDSVREKVLSVRIGGNDLLNTIGVRRSVEHTIYDTAVGQLITSLSWLYKPYGINLTAPVFEGLNQNAVLAEEVRRDLANGLFGKTAIHPSQIAIIEEAYKVKASDLEMARKIIAPSAPAVFRMHDTMCEPTTHMDWAESIILRAELYGVMEEQVTQAAAQEERVMAFA